jgi:hypothetical protein
MTGRLEVVTLRVLLGFRPAEEATIQAFCSLLHPTPKHTMSEKSEAPSTDSSAPVIESVDIGPYPGPKPEGLFDEMPTVTARFSDGTKEDLFSFYPDEIDFEEEELIGLTRAEANALRQEKDRDYLQS